MKERGRRRRMVGTVTSDKMEKTVVVEVDRLVRDEKYEKTVRMRKRHKAHNEGNEAKLGDVVEIVESRPMSRTKCWRVSKIVRRGMGVVDVSDEDKVGLEGARKEKVAGAAPAKAPTAPEKEVTGDTKRDQT